MHLPRALRWLTLRQPVLPFLFVLSAFAAEPLTTSSSVQLPPIADLRPVFEKHGFDRKQQGSRNTCSVFTLTGALEFAIAQRQGRTPRLSVEFLNWAANKTCGEDEDGGFFSDLWNGY